MFPKDWPLNEEDRNVADASEALLSFKNGGMVTDIKEELNEEEFGPASLGLHRVGENPPSKPQSSSVQPVLNRRGMPVRIRKKNRLFFDDDIESSVVVPRSMLKTTRVKTPGKRGRKPKEPVELIDVKVDNGERKIGQKIGKRLRNLLKLPKAHKWVCYEWFCSNIDSALFGGENDFMTCLKESFPQLKTYMLTRVEWCKLRRIMGKPRRCSQAFFEEERKELERKRGKIRQLQQRKPTDVNACKDLPSEIPLQLVIGTKVTARLRSPQDGLFTGSVDAFDTSNNTYRITFERPGLGTHSIPDFEVLSNEPVETISVISMAHALRPEKKPLIMSDLGGVGGIGNQKGVESSSNGFPESALEEIVKLNKVLEIKRVQVEMLKEMNCEAEKSHSYGLRPTEDFVKRYASCIVELEHTNIVLKDHLATVQKHCQKLVPDMSMVAVLTPNYLRDKSLADSAAMVQTLNKTVKHPTLLELVIELNALMIQVKSLSESDRNDYEVEVLTTSMNSIKKNLSPANKIIFESIIEVHIRHIQSKLSGDNSSFSVLSMRKL